MTVPAFRSAASADGSGTSIVVSLPAGAAVDDLCCVQISTDGSGTISPPSGFSRMPSGGGHAGTSVVATDTLQGYGYYGFLTEAQVSAGSLTFTNGTSRAWLVHATCWTSVNKDVPFGSRQAIVNTGGTSIALQSGYPLLDESLGVSFIWANVASDLTGQALTSAGNWTKRSAVDRDADFLFAMVCDNATSFASRSPSTPVGGGASFGLSITRPAISVTLALNPASVDLTTTVKAGWGYPTGTASATTIPVDNDQFHILPGVTVMAISALNDKTKTVSNIIVGTSGKFWTFREVVDHTVDNLRMYVHEVTYAESDCHTRNEASNISTLTASAASGIMSVTCSYIAATALRGVLETEWFQEPSATTTPNPPALSGAVDARPGAFGILASASAATPAFGTISAGWTKVAEQTPFGRLGCGFKESIADNEDPAAFVAAGSDDWLLLTMKIGIAETVVGFVGGNMLTCIVD